MIRCDDARYVRGARAVIAVRFSWLPTRGSGLRGRQFTTYVGDGRRAVLRNKRGEILWRRPR